MISESTQLIISKGIKESGLETTFQSIFKPWCPTHINFPHTLYTSSTSLEQEETLAPLSIRLNSLVYDYENFLTSKSWVFLELTHRNHLVGIIASGSIAMIIYFELSGLIEKTSPPSNFHVYVSTSSYYDKPSYICLNEIFLHVWYLQ